MNQEIIKKYEKALTLANEKEDLKCHVPQIEKTLSRLKKTCNSTVIEEVWVDYFLPEEA